MALVAEEVCLGDRHEQGVGADGRELNPFQWESIRLNLPGSREYDPCKSWISKLRADGRVACGLFTFVDDELVTGPDQDLTWQARGQPRPGVQTELSGDSRRREEGQAKQQNAWGLGWSYSAHFGLTGSLCTYLH